MKLVLQWHNVLGGNGDDLINMFCQLRYDRDDLINMFCQLNYERDGGDRINMFCQLIYQRDGDDLDQHVLSVNLRER